MTDEPLIYTSKGNLPVASLDYRCHREDTPENVILIEQYFLGEELVKRSVHVCPLVGQTTEAEAASLV